MMDARTLRTLAGPAALLALLVVVALVARPLVPIDETRYVGVAWEMWLRGDVLVPFRNGEPYSDKPPLLFWLYNLGWTVFGVSEWWPRLVSPSFSLGSLFLTLWIARRLWPDSAETARTALWVLVGSLSWLFLSTVAMFDAMLAFFVLVGIAGLIMAADGATWRGFAWFAFALGFGALAKGPVVLLHLVPAAVSAPWWTPGLERPRWYGALAVAVAGGACIALAWAVPAALAGGDDYRGAILWGQTADRVVASFSHERPAWWYLPALPLLLFPWLAWPGLWARAAAVGREGLDRGLRLCLAWMVPAFVGFSSISGKQLHYLLPLVPAFALLAARLSSRGDTRGVGLPALLTALVGGVLVHVSVAGVPGAVALPGELPTWPGVVLLATAMAAIPLARRRQARPLVLATMSACLLGMVQCFVAPGIARTHDVRPMAAAIAARQRQRIPVVNVGRYQAQFHFAGRLEQPLAESTLADLPAWLERHPRGVVVAYVGRGQPLPEALFDQPYRGEIVVLLSAEQALRQRHLLRDK